MLITSSRHENAIQANPEKRKHLYMYIEHLKWYVIYKKTHTLSPISETNINENAAVKPDLAIAAKIDEGPPFTKAMSEYTKAHPQSTETRDRTYGS